jgi:hypothetical protein
VLHLHFQRSLVAMRQHEWRFAIGCKQRAGGLFLVFGYFFLDKAFRASPCNRLAVSAGLLILIRAIQPSP